MADKTYQVTGPLAVITDATGKIRYYYGGAVLPDDLPQEEVDKMINRGLVSEIDEDGNVVKREDPEPAQDDATTRTTSSATPTMARPARK